jgi:hypothetical protein
MTQSEINEVVKQLLRAVEILEQPNVITAKIDTLTRIGAICTAHGTRWKNEESDRFIAETN